MNILENFKDLFLEIWQTGIAGVNFTQILKSEVLQPNYCFNFPLFCLVSIWF